MKIDPFHLVMVPTSTEPMAFPLVATVLKCPQCVCPSFRAYDVTNGNVILECNACGKLVTVYVLLKACLVLDEPIKPVGGTVCKDLS